MISEIRLRVVGKSSQKRYLKSFAVSAFLFFVGSCGGYQVCKHEKIADRITAKTAKRIEEKTHLYLAGTGGRMMDDIKEMDMGFDYYGEVDLAEARRMLVYVIDEYLAAINSSQEIRPYLHEYPFNAKNVGIRIWFYNPDRSNLARDKIYYISAINGILNYYIEGKKEFTREAICTETYEEALERLGKHQELTLGLQCASF